MNARRTGFTLIELVVTVAIVGLLSSIAVPLAQLTVQRSREQDLRRALWEIRGAIDAYKRATEEGRVARGALDSGYPPRLEVLVEGVPDIKRVDKARIYFLRRLPRDPFAPAHLPPPDTWGKRSYASPPNAPAEGADVFDVYSRASGTGLNGMAYRSW